MEQHIYRVGDKVLHSDFGEGLIVEIRDRRFYDILEVVFSGGVKRLTSIHPFLQPKPKTRESESGPSEKRSSGRSRIQTKGHKKEKWLVHSFSLL